MVKWLIIAAVALTIFTVPVAFAKRPQTPVKVASTAGAAAPASVPLNATTIFTLVNAERTQRGLKPLIRDTRLDASAQTKADDMYINNYFGHVSPSTGVHGYENIDPKLCSYRSENLTETYVGETGNLSEKSVESWIKSTSHREAILNPQYSLTGVAVSGNKVVQHFCTTW